ncbi:MAG: chemotaxis protein CheW [Pseudomonadota bacterium]|nr:chemotaxis protein CheW [Pseudomonadota bacterium]
MSDHATARRRDDSLSRWVCFALDHQIYGLPIGDVQEVLSQFDIEPVPGAADEVLGVINLRGTVVTVIDLRRRLNLPAAATDAETRVVVVESGGECFGLLVDRVADVRKIIDNAIKRAPDVGAGARQARVHGVYTRDGDLLTLLDTASVLDCVQLPAD